MIEVQEGLSTEVFIFNCLGDVNLKDNKLGNSFLKNNAINCLFTKELDTLSDSVILFGRKFNVDAAVLLHHREIFNGCRKNFLLVFQCASKSDVRTLGNRSYAESRLRNNNQLRKEICEFMYFTNLYFAKVRDDDFIAFCRQILLTFLQSLLSLWNLVLRDANFTFPGNPLCFKSGHAAFHLFHLQLDLKCYKLMILYRLEQLIPICDVQDVLLDNNDDIKHYILYLLKDVFTGALSRFETLSDHEVRRKSPFACTCVKELWLFLQIFMDKYQLFSQQNGFWTGINNLCITLPGFVSEAQKNASDILSCSNPVLYSLWILFHAGQLYSYSLQGDYVGSLSDRMLSNYPLLEKSLKLLLSAEIVSEAQLRLCIPFVTDIVMNLWPPHREPICKLWEHFHHRLNGCFYLQGSSPDTIAITRSSGAELLMQVISVIDPAQNMNCSFHSENSFHLFLHFLGIFLKKNPSQWSSIKGRIFSKFSLTKMQSLKEMGIYNFSTLFLTMAVAGQTREVGEKMQELFQHMLNPSLDLNRRLVIWKANLALLQLFIEKEIDIADIAKILMDDVNSVSNFKNRDTSILFCLFSRGLKDIVDASKALNLSEFSLMGNWIHSYLKLAPESTLLIDTLVQIMTRILSISQSIGSIEYNALESPLTKMYLALCKYLLPYIKEKFATFDNKSSFDKVADLAVYISLLAINRSNVGVISTSVTHLFECFAVNANPLNGKLSVRYVCRLLQEEGILSELMETYNNYDRLIIQTWLRCSVYICEEESGSELPKLTQIVCEIPSFRTMYQGISIDLEWEAKPIETFIKMIKQLYEQRNTMEDKSEFRDECIQYLIPTVKSFERLLRCKDVSERIYLRIYQVAALLIKNCGPIIYSKLQPQCIFNNLVNSLLLPVTLLKPNVEMPTAILNAIQRTFPDFVNAIVILNHATNNSLLPIIKNLIIKYFPRLVGKSVAYLQDQYKTTTSLPGHPLILCFGNNKDVSQLILEIITQTFIKVGEPQCMNALMFLVEVLREKTFDEEIVNLIVDVSLRHVLEVVIFADPSMQVIKRHAQNMLKELLSNKINHSPELRSKFWSILFPLVQRHVVTRTVNVMSLLLKICDVAPNIVKSGFNDIKEMMKSPSVFYQTNVAKTVRVGVENMEKLLHLSR